MGLGHYWRPLFLNISFQLLMLHLWASPWGMSPVSHLLTDAHSLCCLGLRNVDIGKPSSHVALSSDLLFIMVTTLGLWPRLLKERSEHSRSDRGQPIEGWGGTFLLKAKCES